MRVQDSPGWMTLRLTRLLARAATCAGLMTCASNAAPSIQIPFVGDFHRRPASSTTQLSSFEVTVVDGFGDAVGGKRGMSGYTLQRHVARPPGRRYAKA